MQDTEAFFDALRRSADAEAVGADLIRRGCDQDPVAMTALACAASRGLA